MRVLTALVAAATLTAAMASAAPDASAYGFRGFHHSHWGHHFHRWGFRWHSSYRWHYRYHWGYRYGSRPYSVAINTAPRACPPGTHLGYLGRYCHPNRS